MFVAHTIGVVAGDGPERSTVTAFLSQQGHEVAGAELTEDGGPSHDDVLHLSAVIVDDTSAGNVHHLLDRSRNEDGGIHPPFLIIVPAGADPEPYLAIGFADVIHRPLTKVVLEARLRPHLALRKAYLQTFPILFEHTPLGVFRMRSDGEITLANPALLQMLGYSSFEELRSAAGSLHRSPLPPPEPSVMETVWMRRDGSPIQVLQRTQPVFSPGGRLLSYEGMVEDLSVRHMVEEALKEHAARLTLAMDAASMGDFEYNFRRDVLECSFPVFRLLGYSEEPVSRSGERILQRVHPDDVEALRESLRGAISEEATWQHEFRVVWPDETVHWLVARGEVFRNSEGDPERLIGVVRDATADKKLRLDLIAAKQEAEKMAELKSIFLANMSHEIRTPLTAIIGFASLLATRVSEEHRSAVHRIQQGGQRLLETLNAVLMLARLESEQMSLEVEPIDLVVEARSALRMFEHSAREKGIRLGFATSIPDPNLRALADRGALASILQNLIGNAVKFTDAGHVRVAVKALTRDERPHLCVQVRDTGRGIDESFIPHLFDEFRQESTGIRREHEGAGLGLSIVRRLTEMLGGALEVTSKKGEGSTFSVYFPAERVTPRPREAPKALIERTNGETRPDLLVVEDNQDTRELLEELLHDRFDVTLAGSAQEALRCTHERTFDVVLMDINLGEGSSGEEVALTLREQPNYRTVPIIALTAYALPGDAEHFLTRGFTAHLPKPFRPSDLFELIDRLEA